MFNFIFYILTIDIHQLFIYAWSEKTLFSSCKWSKNILCTFLRKACPSNCFTSTLVFYFDIHRCLSAYVAKMVVVVNYDDIPATFGYCGYISSACTLMELNSGTVGETKVRERVSSLKWYSLTRALYGRFSS